MCCRGLENVEFVRDKFAREHQAGPAGESGTMKQVRSHLGRYARQTESVVVLAGSVCLRVLVNMESGKKGVERRVGLCF